MTKYDIHICISVFVHDKCILVNRLFIILVNRPVHYYVHFFTLLNSLAYLKYQQRAYTYSLVRVSEQYALYP